MYSREERGVVAEIFCCVEKGRPMHSMHRVRALKGIGLQLDRHALEHGTHRVSLIAAEDIDAANQGYSPKFLPEDTRRNIVTKGIVLAKLINHEFRIGTARMRGVAPCGPCERPSEVCGKPGFRNAFLGRGGILAEVVHDGWVQVGDRIWIIH